MWMKSTGRKTLAGVVLLMLITSAPAGAGSILRTAEKALQAPEWCYCARICQVTRGRASGASLVPPDQSLAICPQLHDEVIYDNMANCACPQRKRDQTPQAWPNWDQREVTSPNR